MGRLGALGGGAGIAPGGLYQHDRGSARERDRHRAGGLVGLGEDRVERHGDVLQRPAGALDGQAGEVGEFEDGEGGAGREVEFLRAGGEWHGGLVAVGERHTEPAGGIAQRQHQVHEGVVGSRAAAGADQQEVGGAARDGGVDRQLAVGPVLVAWKGLARGLCMTGIERRIDRIEVADPELRHDAERCGMHHAAVGGDDARRRNGAAEVSGRPDRACEKDGEAAHAAAVAAGEGRGNHRSARPPSPKANRRGRRCRIAGPGAGRGWGLRMQRPLFGPGRSAAAVPLSCLARRAGYAGLAHTGCLRAERLFANPPNLIRLVPAEG